jgi:hypothetical protein
MQKILSALSNHTGFQAGSFGFYVGYNDMGHWQLINTKRVNNTWEVDRVMSFSNPYTACLAAHKVLARIMFFAGAGMKNPEQVLIVDLNALLNAYYSFKAQNAYVKFYETLELATGDEYEFLWALDIPVLVDAE